MINKLMLTSAVVAATVAILAPQVAKADEIILDNGMPVMETTPVILDRTINTVPVIEQPTYVQTAPMAPLVAPDFYTVQRRHFLRFGLGNLLNLGLF